MNEIFYPLDRTSQFETVQVTLYKDSEIWIINEEGEEVVFTWDIASESYQGYYNGKKGYIYA